MILGLDRHPAAHCFIELETTLSALQHEMFDCRTIVLNAHSFPAEVPPNAIVMNLENVPGQIPDPIALWGKREIWDFSASNAIRYGAKHVPIGYHPSMVRFSPRAEKDIDIVFTGCVNKRRGHVLNALTDHGLKVETIAHGIYGAERDQVLARAKLALNMLYYEDGVFPALRVAHLVANQVPVLSEFSREGWGFVPTCKYEEMVDTSLAMLLTIQETREQAKASCEAFRKMTMILPKNSG